jgi:membrane-bound lytic murein transglycosylase D
MTVDTLTSAFDVSPEILREYNPALLPAVWSGTKYVPRGFNLRLPDNPYDRSPTQILAAIPGGQRFAAQTPDLQHKVERGDSLSAIAARYGTSVSELVALNNLQSRHRIRVGQTVNLPYRGRASAIVIPAGADTYVVQAGDTVGTIAKRAGVDQRELLEINSLANKHRIYPGQELVLRVAVEPAPVASVSAAKPASSVSEPRPALRDREAIEEAIEAAANEAIDEEADEALEAAASEAIDEEADEAITDDKRAEQVAEIIGEPIGTAAELVLQADPSDYLVAADGTIEVQAAETLGHYADWLNIPTQILRDLNGYSFRTPLVIGHRVRLDFSNVDGDQFAALRIAYHRELQEAFFTRYHIVDTTVHHMRRGESLFVLSLRRYRVPVWLLRQYNPDLDLDRVRPGTEIVFPKIALAGLAGESEPAVTGSS